MRFNPGAMALTILGWTPGLREVVAGRVLDCGCLVGVYETTQGSVVEIVDGCGDRCRYPEHTINRVLGMALTTYGAQIQAVTDDREISALPHHFLAGKN